MLLLDVCEKGGIAEITFAAWTLEVPGGSIHASLAD